MTLRRLNLSTTIAAASLLAGGLYTVLPQGSPSFVPGRVLLFLAPAAASMACLIAVRALPPSASGPWSLLSVSALLAALAMAAGPWPAASGAAVLMPLAYLASHALFALAVAWLAHQRDAGRQREILVDGGLLAAVLAALLFHASPALHRAAGAADSSRGEPALTLATLIAAGCALVFAAALFLTRRKTDAADSAGITGAAALLGIFVAPAVLAAPICCPPGRPYAAASVGAWGFLTYAAVNVTRRRASNLAPAGRDEGGRLLRRLVAPAAALAVGAITLDAVLRPTPLLPATAIALAAAAVLLAVRVGHLLDVTRRSSAERLELKQTRALVELSRALSSTTELDQTLDVVTHWACRLLNANAAVLELVSDDGDMLVIRAATGLPPEAIGLSSPVDGSFTGWVVRRGMPRATTDPRREPDIRDETRPLLGKSPIVAVPLRYHGQTLGVLACVSARPFEMGDFVLLGALADQAAVAIENARLFEQVDTLSKTDPLTGLSNRRRLELDLEREFAAATRGRKLIAVMFDLNEFKDYNDCYGHVAGDDVLRLFARVLTSQTRSANPPARYGGDEFVVLLTETDLNGARLFTERVRSQFSQQVASLQRRAVSVAAGFAQYEPDMRGPDDLIDAADRALYASKAHRPRTG